jgi:large subunit ribosomal protein L23
MKRLPLENIILAPCVSEKATMIGEKNNQVVFRVMAHATKQSVKAAAEKMFKAKVDNVNVLNVKSKRKSFRQRPGLRKGWKKAYVTFDKDSDINFLGVEGA